MYLCSLLLDTESALGGELSLVVQRWVPVGSVNQYILFLGRSHRFKVVYCLGLLGLL